ncbi:MAG: DegV family protein [Clostridia bacterium]|nr:DegV family protein [Clostridia bacterium]
MAKIRLLTDTASDIDLKTAQKYDLVLIPMTVTIGQKEYKEAYDFTKEEFYHMLPEGDEIPTTAQVPPFEFLDAIKAAYKDDVTDLIIVTINQKASFTYNSAQLARKMFQNDVPDSGMNIYVINTMAYSYCYGYPVVQAAKMAKENKPVEIILNYLEDWFSRIEVYFTVFDLKYAKKSGRIGGAAAIAGELLGIKPIMCLTRGDSVNAQKVRGIPKAMDALLEIAKEKIGEDKQYVLFHGKNDPKDFVKLMKDGLKEKPLENNLIGSCIVCNAGPEVVGICFLGEKRDEEIIC